jgi:hypothetical protein
VLTLLRTQLRTGLPSCRGENAQPCVDNARLSRVRRYVLDMTIAVTEREGKDVSPTDCMVLSTSQGAVEDEAAERNN